MGRFQQTFTPEYERQLCQHVIELDIRLMPLTRSEFLRFAYDLAEISTVESRSIVSTSIVFPHVLFAIFGPELSSI